MPTLHDTGPQLQRSVRAGFILKGTTLHAWCKANGLYQQNVNMALLGKWNGPRAKALVARLLAEVDSSDA